MKAPRPELSWDEEAQDSEGQRKESFYLEAPAGHRYRAMLQEQRLKWAPGGCFLRAQEEPTKPHRRHSMWAAVILKGCCNHTL